MSTTQWPAGFKRVPPFFRVSGPISDDWPRGLQLIVAWGIRRKYAELNQWNARFSELALNDSQNPIVGDAAKAYREPIWFGRDQDELVSWLLERLYEMPSGTVVEVKRSEVLVVDYDRRRFEYKGVPILMKGDVADGKIALPPFEAKLLAALANDPGAALHEDQLWKFITRLRGVHSASGPGRIRAHMMKLREVFASQTEIDAEEFNDVFESLGERVWRLNLDRDEVTMKKPRLLPEPTCSE